MTVRTSKTFANYRAKSVQLVRAYEAFEKTYVTDEVRTKVRELSKDFKDITEPDEIKKVLGEQSEKYAELIRLTNEIQVNMALAKEMFLIDNDFKNARELCGIWFEDCDFDIEKEKPYPEFQAFLLGTFEDFFQNHVLLAISAIRGTQHLITGTNPSQT